MHAFIFNPKYLLNHAELRGKCHRQFFPPFYLQQNHLLLCQWLDLNFKSKKKLKLRSWAGHSFFFPSDRISLQFISWTSAAITNIARDNFVANNMGEKCFWHPPRNSAWFRRYFVLKMKHANIEKHENILEQLPTLKIYISKLMLNLALILCSLWKQYKEKTTANFWALSDMF